MFKQTIRLVAIATALVTSTAAAQDANRLTIHGYLTQAFAQSDGGTVVGVPKRGTTNYRNAALQFRYALSAQDNIMVQLSHRSLGEDLATAGESDLALDWAFYGRRIGAVDVRVGRSPIPAGIYNELRDVGVVLPLFRAPFGFYLEGAFTSETVDGVVARWQFGESSSWGAEFSGFAGGWDMIERSVSNAGVVQSMTSRVERGVGGQVWVTTPVQGLRVGAGVSRYEVPQGGVLPGDWDEQHLSLDASFNRLTVRSEFRHIGTSDIDYEAWYAYAGVRATAALTLHAQIERSDLLLPPVPLLDFHDEDVLGASWAFRSNLVLKAEAHWTEGFWAENPATRIGIDTGRKVNYGIISLSTSF